MSADVSPSPGASAQKNPAADAAQTSAGGATWFKALAPRPAATVRLMCFHHAGGGANGYRWLARALPDFIEVLAIQLPGREARASERPEDDLGRVLDALIAAAPGHLAQPYAIFGHSLGALLGYQFACRATEMGRLTAPVGLFVSAAAAPGGPSRGVAAAADDAALMRMLADLGGTPSPLLGELGLMAALLPVLRADLTMLSAARAVRGRRLDCPIYGFVGDRDPSLAIEDLSGWADASSRPTELSIIPGGHFYGAAGQRALVSALTRHLRDAVHDDYDKV